MDALTDQDRLDIRGALETLDRIGYRLRKTRHYLYLEVTQGDGRVDSVPVGLYHLEAVVKHSSKEAVMASTWGIGHEPKGDDMKDKNEAEPEGT